MAENTIDSLNIEITAGVNSAVKAIQTAKRNLTGLQKIIDRVNELQFNSDAVKTFTESMEKVSSVCAGAKMDKAIANIEKLTKLKAFKVKVPEIKVPDTQSFEDIKKITDAAADAYNSRYRNLRTSGTVGEGGGLNMQEIDSARAGVEAYINVYSAGMDELGAKTKRNAAQFDELAKRAWEASEQAKRAVDSVGTKKSGFEGLSSRFDGVKEKFRSLGERVKESMSGIWKNVKSFSSKIGGALKNLLGGAFKKLTNSIFPKRTSGKRTIFDMLGRSLMFTAFYKAINGITKALKEGTDNLYQYSKAMGGSFASSLDSMSSSMLHLKNSIAAAAAPLIQSLAPAIDWIADKIAAFSNVLNQLFAKLTGASTWTKAVKIQKDYADALDDTSKTAKKTQNVLVGFDQLNIFNPTSGSSKFTGANPDPKTMFETMDIETVDENISKLADDIGKTIDEIKAKISSNDWGGAGETLADKLNGFFANFDSTDVVRKFAGVLQGLIDAYNGFMRQFNFERLGTIVGNALNTLVNNINPESVGAAFAQKWNALVNLIYGFVTETDWSRVGEWISGVVNGWFTEIDWGKLSDTINSIVSGAFDLVISFIRGTDWRQISKVIAEVISSFDIRSTLGNIGTYISELVKGALDLAASFIENLDWGLLVDGIWYGAIDMITNVDWSGIVSRAFEILGAVIAAETSKVATLALDIWETLKRVWESVKEYFNGYIDDFGGDIVRGLWEGIKNAFKSVGTWIKENIFDPFINGFKNAFGIHSPSTVMAEMGGYLIEGLLNGLSETWVNITKWLSDAIGWVKNTVTTGFTDIQKGVLQIWNDIWGGIKKVINSILSGVESFANGIVGGFNKVINSLNALSFEVPDWIPGIGGNTIGFNIKEISEVRIPRLAEGGVARKPTPALIGEYVGAADNPEIVSPQDLMYETVLRANNDSNAASDKTLREILKAIRESDNSDRPIVVQVLTSDIVEGLDRKNRRTGKTVIPVGV